MPWSLSTLDMSMEVTVPMNILSFQSTRSTVFPGLMKAMFWSVTLMVTSMLTVLEIITTVSPLLTSWPGSMAQEVTVPSMGATALKSASFFSSSSTFC